MCLRSLGKAWFLVAFLLVTLASPPVAAQVASVDASQIAQVKNNAEGAALLKSWSDRSRAGVSGMIAQELSISKEIESGYARLIKSCEIAAALKDNAPKVDSSQAGLYLKQFDDRLARIVTVQQEVVGKAQAMIKSLDDNPPANCGLFSGDSLPCQTYKYKKEMASYLQSSANTYYDIVNKRYQLYKAIANKGREQCVRPDFLAKLASSDEEYLVSYERKSTQVFLRLLDAVQSAFLNSAP
jgi:hypothetical protein